MSSDDPIFLMLFAASLWSEFELTSPVILQFSSTTNTSA